MQSFVFSHAGVGQDYNATSAIDVEGVPPQMIAVTIANSAYNGMNVTAPSTGLVMKNCTVRNSRGMINSAVLSTSSNAIS